MCSAYPKWRLSVSFPLILVYTYSMCNVMAILYIALIFIYAFWIWYGRLLRLVQASSSNGVLCDACYWPAHSHWTEIASEVRRSRHWGLGTVVRHPCALPIWRLYLHTVQTCPMRRGFAPAVSIHVAEIREPHEPISTWQAGLISSQCKDLMRPQLCMEMMIRELKPP